jgi:succinylglutamate desuccinylase
MTKIFSVWTALLFLTLILWVTASTAASAPWSSGHAGIENIVVVGGTHGNEYTGVWCIKSLDRVGPLGGPYPSLKISTLLGNPQAHYENKRFIDSDLNREFTHDKLQELHDMDDDMLVGSEGLPLTVESLRAKEVNMLLGPKFGEKPTDLIVDLHSTTSNMGTTIIIPEGDAVMAKAAAYVLKSCQDNEHGDQVRILMHPTPDRRQRPHLSSTGRHGFTIEVGPVPQGVLRHDAVEKTQRALAALFEFLQRAHQNQESLVKELQELFPTGRVPCFLSAASATRNDDDTSYGTKHSTGKIAWPSDPENPNFPSVLVHKHLQDRDFHKIRTGDVLFVDLDGKEIAYDGSHGDEVYLIFVNEGGYYYQSSGTGIGVAVDAEFDLDEGMLQSLEKEPHETGSTTTSDKEL